MIEEIIPEEVILDEEEVLDESAGTEGLNPLQQAPAQPQFGYQFGSVGQGMQPSLVAPPVVMDRKYGAKGSDYMHGAPVEKDLPVTDEIIIAEDK